MLRLYFTLLAVAVAGTMAASDSMGPAAFMWPPDRVWNAQMDNTSPCGSVGSSTNRTRFPLTNGAVSVTAQDDSYSFTMSVSFKNDPQSQSDFTYVLTPVPISEIDPGHTCLRIANPPSTIAAGTNATIQIKYTADFDRPENQTFYACTDITYVRSEDFDLDDIPCFNATSPDNVPAPTATGTPDNVPGHGDNGPPLATTGTPAAVPQAGSLGVTLSKGAIAGAVVGSLLGLALIAGLGLLFYRKRQKKMRLERQRDSARGVGWRADDPGKDSVSTQSIRLGEVAK